MTTTCIQSPSCPPNPPQFSLSGIQRLISSNTSQGQGPVIATSQDIQVQWLAIDPLRPPGARLFTAPVLGDVPLMVSGDDTYLLGMSPDLLPVGLVTYHDVCTSVLHTAQALLGPVGDERVINKADHALRVLAEHLIAQGAEPKETVSRTLRQWLVGSSPMATVRAIRTAAAYWRWSLLLDALGPDDLAAYLLAGSRFSGKGQPCR